MSAPQGSADAVGRRQTALCTLARVTRTSVSFMESASKATCEAALNPDVFWPGRKLGPSTSLRTDDTSQCTAWRGLGSDQGQEPLGSHHSHVSFPRLTDPALRLTDPAPWPTDLAPRLKDPARQKADKRLACGFNLDYVTQADRKSRLGK